MRIAFVLTQTSGGPVDLTVSLAQELSGRPDVDVVVVGPPPESSAGSVDDLLREVHVGSKTDVRGGRRLRSVLVDVAPDVVHAQDRRASLWATRRRAGGAPPVVMTYHGVPDDAAGLWVRQGPLAGARPSRRGRMVLRADRLVTRRTAAVVAPSAAMARFLGEQLSLDDTAVHVIRNGVGPGAAHTPTGPATRFVATGGFARAKAMPSLVEAFVDVARSAPDAVLRLVGDGDDRATCERRVAAASLDDRVEFTGHTTRVPDHLGWADAFLLPSINENLPLGLLEAMRTGLACAASDVGGVGEAVADGDTGLLLPPGNHAALVDAMRRLGDDPSLAPTLGSRAREVGDRDFTIERSADEHLALYRTLART